MLTTGKLIFTGIFIVVFVIAMLWSYKKDSFSDKLHFRGASKILVITIIVILLMLLYVKMRHRL